MGFAPADDPKIAIYVVVDRPNVEKQGNARLATGLVRSILTEVLPYLNIFMTEELSESEIRELEALNLEIIQEYIRKPDSGTGEGGTDPEDPRTDTGSQPWQTFPLDPESGYRVDPATGYRYDAQEGFLIDSVMGADGPVNPDIN